MGRREETETPSTAQGRKTQGVEQYCALSTHGHLFLTKMEIISSVA